MKALLPVVCFLLASCTTLSPHPLEDFQQAAKTQDFRQAERIADRIGADHPDHAAVQKQLPQLRRSEQQYLTDTTTAVRSHLDRQQFDKARELIAGAEKKLPAGNRQDMDTLKQEVARQEQQQTNLRLADLWNSEAEWLLGQQSSLAFLGNQSIDRPAQRAARSLADRRQALAGQLATLGSQFAELEDWNSSQRCLVMAERLDKSMSQPELLARVQARISAIRSRQVQQKNGQLQDEANALVARYRDSKKIGDLLAALRFVNARNRNGELLDQAQLLDAARHERIEQDMKQGDAFYANGRYAEAKRSWHSLTPLAPDNDELKKKLERVNRVLESLDTLKQQGTPKK